MRTVFKLLKPGPLVLLLLLLLGSNKSHASHFAAIDMIIKYIGNGIDPCKPAPDYTYEVTLIVYGDCAGIPVGYTAGDVLRYRSVNAGIDSTNVDMDCIDHTTGLSAGSGYQGEIVHGLCPVFGNNNACINPSSPYPAFKKWVFKRIVTLPSPQSDWTFSWTSGARNSAVKNVSPSNIYVEAGINNLAKYNINTPVFSAFPLPYICRGVNETYLNGPMDIDQNTKGQTMEVLSINPLNSAANDPLPYQSGYTLQNPLQSSTGYKVNAVSGTAQFNIANTGNYVLAFRCNKYAEDGTLLSWAHRDVQISALNCTKESPVIDTIPQKIVNATWRQMSDKGDSAIYVCPGSELSFEINGYNFDPTKANKLYWSSNYAQALSGSVLQRFGEGTDQIKGIIKWTPTLNDIGDHTLILSVDDSTCDSDIPIILSSAASFVIRVVSGLDAGPDLPTCQFNPMGNQLKVKGADYKLKVNWTNIDGGPAVSMDDPTSATPKVYAKGGIAYVVQTPDLIGKCKSKDTVALYSLFENEIDAYPNNPVILCRPDYLQLDAVFKGKTPLTNRQCGTNDPIICDKLDSIGVYGSFVYDAKVTYDTMGPNAHLFSNAVKTQKQQFLITKEELRKYGAQPSTLYALSFNITDAQEPDHEYSNFTISLKCTDKTTLAKAKSSDGFETGMVPVYSATAPIKFDKRWHEFKFDLPYNLDSTKGLIVEFCYHDNADVKSCFSPMLEYAPTNYISGLTLTPSAISATNVCGTDISPEIVPTFSRPRLVFAYCDAPAAPITYTWTPSTFLSDSTIQQPLAYIAKSTKYVVESFGRNGCKMFDTVDIFVPTKNYTVSPDTAICFGESPMLTAKGGFTYKWWEYVNGQYKFASSLSEDRVANPIASPKVTTTYKIVVYDSLWCTDTIETKLTVLPLPHIKILTPDTVVKYGHSLQLMVSGSRSYNWMPAATLSTPFSSNPVATPTEPTKYIVGGIGSNGCRSFDTISVGIDYKDNLFIPTAFSPNGDGRNDLFKITNLTFQKVTEFRVFNRWGQEIFATSGNKDGWDGTWKGEPQGVGNYSYHIRVAFPDGYVETYKGEVTLVR